MRNRSRDRGTPLGPERFTDDQRLRPPPPPPPLGRSVLGRASLTFNARPSSSRPFTAAIAFSASPSLAISTNPKPLGCPESRSVQMLTRSTVPWVSNRERTEASVTPKLRLPTNMFFMFTYPCYCGQLVGRRKRYARWVCQE